MDISPLGIAKNTFTSIPAILKTVVLALIGRSANSSVQDALTEIICVASRPVMATPHDLLASQKQFNADWGIWGRMWVSKVTVPALDKSTSVTGDCEAAIDVQKALARAIAHLGDGKESYSMPDIVGVQAEWTGYRHDAWPITSRPDISEQEQYESMMRDVKPGSPTILYIHGGAFCLMDPSTHRWTTSALAEATGGRCLSIRQRLAPQATFPAALLDALMAYLYLISPPPGSFHEAVPASDIVIAGDSSGASLCASLALLLTTLPQIGISRLKAQGSTVAIPFPAAAGVAVPSPWLDVSRALPSVTRNARFDIIAPPTEGALTPNFPHDEIWPANPPRVETYCNASMVSHPLVSPLAAHSDLWQGAPPMYINVGWEGMQDEAEVFARRVAQARVPICFEGFIGMPHCFGMVPWSASGRRAFKGWAGFCARSVENPESLADGYACWIDKLGDTRRLEVIALGLERDGVEKESRTPLTDDTVDRLMAEAKAWRVEDEAKMQRSKIRP